MIIIASVEMAKKCLAYEKAGGIEAWPISYGIPSRSKYFKKYLLMQLESADTNTPGWFQHRTRASKNVIDAMSKAERKALEDEAKQMWMEGLLVDRQRKSVPMLMTLSAPILTY